MVLHPSKRRKEVGVSRPRTRWDKWGQEVIEVLACIHCGRMAVPYFGIRGPCLPGHSHKTERTKVHRSELAWELARTYHAASLQEREAFDRTASREDKDLLYLGQLQIERESVMRR